MRNSQLKGLLANSVASTSEDLKVLTEDELQALQGEGCGINDCWSYKDAGGGCKVNDCWGYSSTS